MFLSRFGVKNYKCLGEIDIPLTPIHVLIGQNDAGKTSLLEAMAAFYGSSRKPLAQLFPQPWQGRELVFHGSRQPIVEFSGEWRPIQGEVLSGDGGPRLRYGFSCEFPPEENRCRAIKEFLDDAGRRYDSAGPRWDVTLVCYRRPSGDRVAEWSDVDWGLILSSLSRVDKYSLDAGPMSVPAALNPDRRFRLDANGFGLPTLLDDILGHDPERFVKLRTEFCRHFPQFRSVQVRSEGPGKGIVLETKSGQVVHAQQASDGAILFLGFLALSYLPEPPTLLLIEEPENGIYPKRLDEVIKLLKGLVYRKDGTPFPQIIFSTHSPYVLTSFKPEEVTFLSRAPGDPDAPVRARPLRDAPNIRERLAGGEFYLGELWYNLTEEELFGDA
jgi:predicted ATPase